MAVSFTVDPIPDGDWSIESKGDALILKGIPPTSITINSQPKKENFSTCR